MTTASQDLIARDAAVMSPSLSRVLPLAVESAAGSWITDLEGRRYLDFGAGIAVAATGHCHPAVVAAIVAQTQQFLHVAGGAFYYEQQAALAEELAARTYPATRARVLLTNSGSEAIEAALKLARYRTGRQAVIAFHGGFHGRTAGALSVTSSKSIHHRGFGAPVPGTATIPYASDDTDTPLEETIRSVHRLFAESISPTDVAAVLIEPVQGESGYNTAHADLLPWLRALCDEHGIMLIADEIQSGVGRTGKWLALDHTPVAADIVCLGKGLASGLPIGAVTAPDHIMNWPPGSQASTFGGNPVCAAAARATLGVVTQELMAEVQARGDELRAGLQKLRLGHPALTAVKGRGLMIGLDLSEPGQVPRLIHAAFGAGLILLPAGSRSVRICPPLTLSAEEARLGLALLERSFADLTTTSGHPSTT